MITLFLIFIAFFSIGLILNMFTDHELSVTVIMTITIILGALIMVTYTVMDIASKPHEIATPSKYINQTYYIDNNNRIYIQKAHITKSVGKDISDKIEYSDSAKTPAIQFKSISKPTDFDDWIPFKSKIETKTSISKVILPKDALTQKLTKVDVINVPQSDNLDNLD